MKPLIRTPGSVAVGRWPVSAIALLGVLAIAPASGAERVQGQAAGADAPIEIE